VAFGQRNCENIKCVMHFSNSLVTQISRKSTFAKDVR
jgi:predicted Zn-dependent protease